MNRISQFWHLPIVLFLGSCSAFEDFVSFDNEAARSPALTDAEHSALSEMSIMTGRYGVMLGQAREILRLPEPRQPAADKIPAPSPAAIDERKWIAQSQVHIINEFLADTALACRQRRTPAQIRRIACEQSKKVPAELKALPARELKALTIRDQHVGGVILPWWNKVCAAAQKRRGSDPICPME